MNKSGFIEKLEEQTGYAHDRCVIVNDVMESYFFLRKKNKPKIVADLVQRLAVDEAEAAAVYDKARDIINAEMKSALKHPLGKRS